MNTIWFSLDINNVIGPEGNGISEDLTTHLSMDSLKESLAKSLECDEEELDFSKCYYSAEEDFIVDLLELKNGEEPNEYLFDNISTIEKSNISLDILEAARGVLSSSDDFDTIMNHAKENYIGKFHSNADFADYYCEHYEDLEIPDIIQGCINWDAVWNSSLKYDHTKYNQHYFRD